MKIQFNKQKNDNNKYSDTDISDLKNELSSIENKLKNIERIRDSLLLSFVLIHKSNTHCLEKKEKQLKEDWLVLEAFIKELELNGRKVYYRIDGNSAFGYELEA